MSPSHVRLMFSLGLLSWAVAGSGRAVAQAPSVAAAKTLVLAASDRDEASSKARALASRVGAALLRAGEGVLSPAQASASLERLRPLPRATRTPLGGLLAAAQRAFFNEHDTAKARALLQKVRDETSQCDELRTAYLRLALLALTEQKTEEASRHLEALFRADPGAHIEPRDYPPPLRQLGELVRGRLAARGRATVRILAQPAGVRVHVGLCRAGAAPFVLDTLSPGDYEVWADGGRVQRVRLSQGANELRLRVDLDQALRLEGGLSLVGPQAVLSPAHLAALGRLLGVRRVVLVQALSARVTTPATDPDNDTIEYAYVWYRDGVIQSVLVRPTVPAGRALKEETWVVEVSAVADGATGPSALAAVKLGDAIATTPVLAFEPAAPVSHDALSVRFTTESVDADGAPVTYEVVWRKNGVVQNDVVGQSVPAGRVMRSETWSVQVTPVSEGVSGVPATLSVVVGNAPPTWRNVVVYPLRPMVGDSFMALPVGPKDPDDAIAPGPYDVSWYKVEPNGTERAMAGTRTLVEGQWHYQLPVGAGDEVVAAIGLRDLQGQGPLSRSGRRSVTARSPRYEKMYPTARYSTKGVGVAPGCFDSSGGRFLLAEEAPAKPMVAHSDYDWFEFREEALPLAGASGSRGRRLYPGGALPVDRVASFVCDGRGGRLVRLWEVSGTEVAPAVGSEVQVLDLDHGREAWRTLRPAGSAIPMFAPAIDMDRRGGRVFLFGGAPLPGPVSDVVQVLSLAGEGSWQTLDAAGPAPGPRAAGYAAYDHGRERLVVWGGLDSVSETATWLSDVWALELSPQPRWVRLSVVGEGPGARFGSTPIFDSRQERVLVFGGNTATSGGAPSSDVYSLSLRPGQEEWQRLALPPAPVSGGFGAVALDPDSGDYWVELVEQGIVSPQVGSGPLAGTRRSVLRLRETQGSWRWTVVFDGSQMPARGQGTRGFYATPLSQPVFLFGGAAGLGATPIAYHASGWRALPEVGEVPSSRAHPGFAVDRACPGQGCEDEIRFRVHGGECRPVNATPALCDDTLRGSLGANGVVAWEAGQAAGPRPDARDRHAVVHVGGAAFESWAAPGEIRRIRRSSLYWAAIGRMTRARGRPPPTPCRPRFCATVLLLWRMPEAGCFRLAVRRQPAPQTNCGWKRPSVADGLACSCLEARPAVRGRGASTSAKASSPWGVARTLRQAARGCLGATTHFIPVALGSPPAPAGPWEFGSR